MISPANRINSVEEYYFSKKLRQIAEMRQQGISVINLGIGDPDLPPSSEVVQTLQTEAGKPNNHGYQTYTGIPELRNAFCNWYKKHFNVALDSNSEILPLMGSKEGIMHVTLAFVNPGDSILIPDPGYPTYAAVAKLAQANIITYNLTEDTQWLPNLEELEKQDLSQVKLMWVCYPHMPTGACANDVFYKKLINFAIKHQILICNDNPYSFILHNEQRSLLSIEGAKEVVLELNSLSKSHNMPGWRMGMIAGKKEFIQYVIRVKTNMDSGMFKPLQLAAAKALEANEDWYNNNNQLYLVRQKKVYEILDLIGCTYEKTGGMFVWAKIPDKYKNVEELSDKLLEKAHVFITPGIIFGKNGARYLRPSLCINETTLEEAKKRIENVLKDL